jgi:hypothetical protein
MRRIFFPFLIVLFCAAAARSAESVKLTVEKQDDNDVIKLDNYRVKLTITPARGGAVTAYSDKLAPADLILQKPYMGLCMDHFQEQNWPGEFLEQPYEYKILKQTPEEAQVMVWRKATGLWKSEIANPKLSGILLEKTYTLRADSPVLKCEVKLTTPPNEAKVFSYWLQNVFFAGGDYDAAADRTFRPSARGVRSNAAENNGHYGKEDWMRDFSAGWMALIDTRKKTGLAMMCDYDELRINYANVGNRTNEFMFNNIWLPKGQSRTYTIEITPIIGIEKLLYVGPRLIVGYSIRTDNKGGGKIDLEVERSVEPVKEVQFDVAVAGAIKGEEVKAGTLKFTGLADKPQSQSLDLKNAPSDPVVVRVQASGQTSDEKEFAANFEDFFPGTYRWGDNINTDMRTPVYAAERPEQKLNLLKPEKLVIKPEYHGLYLFFHGLLDEEYKVADALHTAGFLSKTDVIYYRYGGSWFGELTDFPYDYDKLLSYSCIVMGGISSSGLKPIGLEMLHDYLLAGGGMVVLGSHGAYGKSQLKGTKLGDAFPVEFSGDVNDLTAVGAKRATFGPDKAQFLKYRSLSDKATCYYIHPAKPKPGAKVLMTVDGKPFMVAGEYGPNNARIVCILGAPMGNPSKDELPFWQDKEWYLILRNAIWWTAKKDKSFEEDSN